MDDTRLVQTPQRHRSGRVREWLRRYAPAEVAATLGAVVSAAGADQFGVPAATAYAATIGEGIAFYGVLLIRDLRLGRGSFARVARGLAVEFGPAELLDTLAVRPGAMLLGPVFLGSVTVGVLAGKIVADLVFYAIAIVSYETGRHYSERKVSANAR
jgi:hypothetical protein